MSNTSSAVSPTVLFAPEASRGLGECVARALDMTLAPSEEREFDAGEHKMRSLVSVRDRDVYIVQTLCGDAKASANDRLCRLLFFIGALKDDGAASVTACVPYLAYARKDRRSKPHDPITTRYVAALFEAVKTDRVVVLDVHNLAAFENAFRIQTVPLDSASLFAQHSLIKGTSGEWVVASPDVGGVKRAQHLREIFETELKRPVGAAFMDKKRSGGLVSGDTLVGDVSGKRVLIVDDIISSGATMSRAVVACRKAGATEVHLAATHAVLAPEVRRLFESEDRTAIPNSVVVTDSVALRSDFTRFIGRGLDVVSIAPLYAEAIRRLHQSADISDLCGL
ncbi:MAG TPA: ribose-phosphate diphosphokinase [Steroidobacteraceae bacterium]|nr:ribose-phosphate diphosphokinase [Steroidobacteraceae bacterium]